MAIQAMGARKNRNRSTTPIPKATEPTALGRRNRLRRLSSAA